MDKFNDLRFQKKQLLALVKKNFAPEDRKKIISALEFARKAHKGQKRIEGTSYIIHPIRAAIILLEDAQIWDADVIVSALLHDVIEDCGVSPKAVEKRFGKRVSRFVELLTRPQRRKEDEFQKETNKIRYLKKLSKASREAKLIKCADILDNMRSAAEVPFYHAAWQSFPRWRREFHRALAFVETVHPVIFRKMRMALNVFELKRFARAVVRLGR
ncbi:MAG: (p)ppGpp synthetase I, SpoT/RelA [Parcubacteria group bacterium GW2011_GWC2_45_7]|nr:MAG: (p)ppGpp synthetase I, SpoT/RelA [Parcubacteria group bacterium GW2011_GWC2_45_7]KKU73977.1 MAG: (p)ppGpp synthetase I, SpoT/RelA [Parcubacteria group bacterium GW2011_GWA2_47_26]